MGNNKSSKIQLSFSECVPGVDTLSEDLLIFTENSNIILPQHPIQVDLGMLTICHKGRTRQFINLKEYELVPGSIMVAMPDQVIEEVERSEDFSASYIGVSRKLINEIIAGMPNMLSNFLFIQEHPLAHLTAVEIKQISRAYSFACEMLSDKTNCYYKQLAFSQISTLFYITFNIYFNHYQLLDKGGQVENPVDSVIFA